MRSVASVLAALLIAACTGTRPSTPSHANLTIFAAASLKAAIEQAQTVYESAHPEVTLTLSTDASASLATQIEQGAPADVFLSADTTNPQKLVDGGFASGPPVAFAANELALIVPIDNPGNVTSPADLGRPGLTVIAAGDEVPITRYANQLLDNLADQPGYPADLAGAYAVNIASREDNVKAIVAKIELGEGDAGIVYLTDARASREVATVPIPDGANVIATYAGVVVKTSPNETAASEFLAWLVGPKGQAKLSEFGFLPPE